MHRCHANPDQIERVEPERYGFGQRHSFNQIGQAVGEGDSSHSTDGKNSILEFKDHGVSLASIAEEDA